MKLIFWGTMFLLAACASQEPKMEDFGKEDLVLRKNKIMAAYLKSGEIKLYNTKDEVIKGLFENLKAIHEQINTAKKPADPAPTQKPQKSK